MEAKGEDRQGRFFEWLARSVSSAQLSELYQAFADLEAALSSNRYPHHMTQPLVETEDGDAVDRLYNDLSTNKQFMRSYRSGIKLSLLRHYARYCRERKIPNAENRLWTKAAYYYLQFAESAKFAVEPTREKQASVEPSAITPTAAREAADPVHASDEKPAVGLIQEDCFRQWLKQNESDEQADQIVDVIRSAGQFAQCNHMHGIKMLGVAPSTMRSSIRRMIASNAFIKSDLRRYQLFKRAAALLVQYGTSLNGHVDANAAPASTTLAAPAAAQADVKPKEDSALEPSLLALLQGEQLSVLRETLIQKGIRTLEDFKRLNLWAFMNQNGLYSIGERQAVYSALRRSMASDAAVESAKRWKIVTLRSEFAGSSPAGALVEYCRSMAGKYPLRFRGLIGQRMARTEVIPLSRTRLDAGDFRMDNPEAYISGETDESSALAFARWIGEMCRDGDVPQQVSSTAPAEAVNPVSGGEGGLPEQIKIDDISPAHVSTEPPMPPSSVAKPSVISPLQRKVEQLVQDADLTGMTLDQLYSRIPGATMVALKQARENSTNLVEIEDRLIHKDAFVDWDEAAQKLEEILEKLLSRNNGYVSAAQLYEYVRAEMRMFLNDNDMDDPRKVFDLAQHLFEKEGYHDKRYNFGMKAHISRRKETLASNLDVIKKFASDRNGFFQFDDLVTYLERVGIRTGNLRGQMQLGIKPIFFYYSDEEIISAQSMRIDEDWLALAGKAFQRLFADVGDHIVLRSINSIWYEQLPTLPGYMPWTPLLLQYILQFYGEQLGAKTIGAELNQKYNALHAMLVTPDSEIQTFADAVVAYLIDSDIPERQFEAEELRRRLVEGGLIAGNELIWNMPRAIGSDPRFAWDASGKKVSIRV